MSWSKGLAAIGAALGLCGVMADGGMLSDWQHWMGIGGRSVQRWMALSWKVEWYLEECC